MGKCIITCIPIYVVSTMTALAGIGESGHKKTIDQLIVDAPYICTGVLMSETIGKAATGLNESRSEVVMVDVTVDRTLKGQLESNLIHVRLIRPVPTTGSLDVSEGSSKRRSRYLFFMDRTQDGTATYKLYENEGTRSGLDYSPVLVRIAPDPPRKTDLTASVEDAVNAEMIAVVEGEDEELARATIEEIWERDPRNPNTFAMLLALSESKKCPVAEMAIARRITIGDTNALGRAHELAGANTCSCDKIGIAIRTLRDSRFVKDLIRFEESRNVAIHRAGLRSLSGLANNENKIQLEPIFKKGLDDDDPQIQYAAMMGLATLYYGPALSQSAGESLAIIPEKPVPSLERFLRNPQRYIRMWKR